MSAWSSMYSVVGGAGKLARVLKEAKQRQILMEAVTADVPDPEQLSISRSWASLSGTNDALSGGISRQVNDIWKLPLEPYRNMKLWLKFNSGLKLKDWSYNNNETRLKSTTVQMPKKSLAKDDSISEGQIYGVFDGESQWVEVENSPAVSFQDLLMDDNEVTLTVFFSPFGGIASDSEGYGDIFYKVDSDEVRYAYRARLKGDGALRFTVVDNYAVYDLETPADVVPHYDIGDFDADDFDNEDFHVMGEAPYQTNIDIQPSDWTIYTFTFNTVTKEMKICSGWQDPDNPSNRTVQVEAQTSALPDFTGLSMLLPINEGNGTILHDASGQDNPGTFHATPANQPAWVNGELKFTGDNQQVAITNSAELNTFTSFTIAFKIKLHSYSVGASLDSIINKGAPGATVANGGFIFYMSGSGSKTMNFVLKNNAGTTRALSLTNAVPLLNTWYDVVATYDGTTFKFSVGGVSATNLTAAGDTFTNSSSIIMGDATLSAQQYLSNFQIFKGRAWNATTDITWFSSRLPSFKGGFPMWNPLPEAEPLDPVPITRPITKIYDVPPPASTTTEFKLNNPASTTPFTSFYNVAGGTPITDPELLKYSVADGTVGSSSTNAFTTVYSLTPASSTGTLDGGELAYGQYIETSSSNIYNKKITEITGYLKKGSSTPSGGAIYLGIIKANGTYIKFGSAIPFSGTGGLTSSYVSFLRSGNNVVGSQYTTAVNDAIGLIWEGSGSGQVNIQRGGSGTHYESSSYSCQNRYDGGWGTPNTDFSMAGLFRIGGETVVGSDPFYKMQVAFPQVAMHQLNSVYEGIVPSRVIWRVKRVGTLSSATVRCVIKNASNVVVATLGSTISASSIGTSVQDLEFILRANTIAWADNFRIVLEYVVTTGVNSTNYIAVNYYDAGQITAIKAQVWHVQSWPYTSQWEDVGSAGTDWAGKVYTGGNDFVPWVALNDTRKRYGEKVNSNVAPVAIGLNRTVTKTTFALRKVGDPQDNITFKIYSGTTAVAQSFSQINAASLTTSELSYDFSWVFNSYVTQLNDYLVIEYNSGTSANYVEVKINTDAAAGTSGDGQKMIAVEYVGGAWIPISNMDVAAVMYTGGVPDLTSRNRVAVFVVTDASLIKSKKTTEASFYFKIFGTVTGSIEVRSRRGSDDTPRDLLGTIPTAGLNSTTWQKKTVVNRDAIHFLGVSDKVCIEYSGGDQTNYVRVMMNPADIFDENNTMMSEYNSVTWSEPVDNLEVVGELWTGGDTYTPPPGTPFIPTPDVYNHNLFICAGGPLTGGNSGNPQCFTGMRIRDFRIVAGDPDYSSLTSLENWIINRHTILPTLKGQVALTAYCTLSSSE